MTEPLGITFWSRGVQEWLRLILDESSEYDGWLCYRDHANNCWLSWRKATPEDLADINGACTYGEK